MENLEIIFSIIGLSIAVSVVNKLRFKRKRKHRHEMYKKLNLGVSVIYYNHELRRKATGEIFFISKNGRGLMVKTFNTPNQVRPTPYSISFYNVHEIVDKCSVH